MTENQDEKINPTWLFLVTGASFALFAFVTDLLNGQHTKTFWWISKVGFILGTITAFCTWINKAGRKPQEDLE
jgi:hypothetical protein